jgi:hypothetical protein
MSLEEIMTLTKTLDDAWNAQNWNTFNKRHTEDVPYTGQVNLSRQEDDLRIKMELSNFKAFPITLLRTIRIRYFLAKVTGVAQ